MIKRYTRDHLWLEKKESNEGQLNQYILGLTKEVLDQLGEIVYVCPAQIGTHNTNTPFAVVESTKAATELFLDFDYELISFNKDFISDPLSLINSKKIEEITIAVIRPIQTEDFLSKTTTSLS